MYEKMIRKITGRFYRFGTRVRNSLITYTNIRKGSYAVEIRNDQGIGAKLAWTLEILAYCDEKCLTPLFKFSYPDSKDDEDYFGHFFSIRLKKNIDPVRFTRIKYIGELGFKKNYGSILNLDLAIYLINKYLLINDNVLMEVDNFCRSHFGNRKILGVHYRGTDKVHEAPLVGYDTVRKNIEYYLNKFPETSSVFISSDEINFIEYIEKAFISRNIIYREDSFRSRNGIPVHKATNIDRYEVNRDAIVNCLILSRCHALLKGSSILSGWSKLFNPQLSLIMLNVPYNNWFPERDLIKEVIYTAI
jgi:hypothetical protein